MKPAKYASRLALSKPLVSAFTQPYRRLGLTPTTPTITFPPDRIRLEPDLTSGALSMGKDYMKDLVAMLGIPWMLSQSQVAHRVC
jgi:hypothetical protein